MRIRPLGEYILIERKQAQSKSTGGIYIPDEFREKAARGTVLATGPGRWSDDGSRRMEPSVKKGDVVLLPSWAGAEDMKSTLKEGLLLVRESELLGVELEEKT